MRYSDRDERLRTVGMDKIQNEHCAIQPLLSEMLGTKAFILTTLEKCVDRAVQDWMKAYSVL